MDELREVLMREAKPFRLSVKGQSRKISIDLDYENALTFADDDINENWEIYSCLQNAEIKRARGIQ